MRRSSIRPAPGHLALLPLVLLAAACAARAPAETAAPIFREYEGWDAAESGALHRLDDAVRARLDSLGVSRDGAKLVLETFEDGAVRVQLVGGGMPSGMPGVQALVSAYVAARADGAPALLSFRLDGAPLGDVLAMEAPAGATLSMPRAINGREVLRLGVRVARSDPTRDIFADATYEPVLEMLVDADGAVAMAEVAERSGSDHFDAYAIGLGYRMRFDPARLDGRAVSVLVSMPLRFFASVS